MALINIILVGIIIGSFLNVCIYRIPIGQSLTLPPSYCKKCGKRIKAYDLIPVISYILLRGRCRFCKDKISLRYPLIELVTGAFFGALYIKYGLSIIFIKYCIFACFLIVIGIIDYDTTDVYFKTTSTGFLIGVFFVIFELLYYGPGIQRVFTYILGGILGFGIIASMILITGGMGWGDAEICLLSGIFLGFKTTIVMMLLSFFIGAVTGIILIVYKKKSRKDYIPFGPFIALSSILSIFFANNLIIWYLNIL